MNEDGFELTSYFHSRERIGGKPFRQALLGLYDGRGVTASILLDRAAVAIGTGPNLKALADHELQLAGPRLVTAERARILTGDIDPAWLNERPGEVTRLTIFSGERDRVYQIPAFEVACELLHRRGVAWAAALSGTDGIMSGRRLRSRFLWGAGEAPIMVVAVDAGERIAMVLPELGNLFRNPVMTMTKVRLCKRDGRTIGRPPYTSDLANGTAQLRLTVCTDRATRRDGRAVHRVIARRLHAAGIDEPVMQCGIWGFDGELHPGHYIPVITTVVGAPEEISAAFDLIDPLTATSGLVTVAEMHHPKIVGVPTTPEGGVGLG
jgi:PII-like signaling protein